MTQITMPKMSDTMEEGRIVRWLKHEGDSVIEGEPVAEIETDKANVEMESFESGVLQQILVQEGETIPVGEPIAVMQREGEAPSPAVEVAAPPEEAPPSVQPTLQAPTPPVEAPPPTEVAPPVEPRVEAPAPAVEAERLRVSPLARKLAVEYGVDVAKIPGTGPNGRIVESDVENYVMQMRAAPPPVPKAPPTTPVPEAAPVRPTQMEVPSEERDLSRMRKTIGERLSKSKQTIPHFYVTAEVNMDWASRVRDELNADESLPRVSFTDLVIKACALALAKSPDANSSFADGKLLVHKQVNIGMAVALDDGLIAPVIRDADKKHIREIAVQTKELAQRAKDNALRASEYTGATFSVSNLGMFDVESFISIINPPECASLAVGTIRAAPVVEGDQVVISKRMKATLSADHRVLDGATAARFLHEIKSALESPIGLL